MTKQFLAVALALIFVVLPCGSYADQTLRQVQDYIGKNAPYYMMSPPIMLTGEVADVYYTGVRNDWQMKIKVDDESAQVPLGSDYAYFIAHFSLHLEECPFKIGDTVMIKGSINSMYSSVMVPMIVVNTINDGYDF